MAKKKGWKELSVFQQIGTIVSSIIQFALFGAALWDIRKRPTREIRGAKWIWTSLSFVNFVGPIAYFLFGRKK